jgi:hypothetical protein
MPTYKDYALQRSQNESLKSTRLGVYLPKKLGSVALEMTQAYRGRSKRMAFNALLRSVKRATIKRFPTDFLRSEDVSGNNQYLSTSSEDRITGRELGSLERKRSQTLNDIEDNPHHQYYQHLQSSDDLDTQLLTSAKATNSSQAAFSLASLKKLVASKSKRSTVAVVVQKPSSKVMLEPSDAAEEWSDFITSSATQDDESHHDHDTISKRHDCQHTHMPSASDMLSTH